ncbi:MAG: ATPase, T2SS/T4P/T4SS family [Actinomycetota bacterium]|jgi:type IV pilus assembly protein PilB|nr:ATPase, T2SS/T4P/T4SS family [Actinomycetota bacterium]
MSDVDAIRSLASEHDLEFVDLDRYSVDPGAADALPEELARQFQAVPVKRRFGTPVVAIADPDDVFAVDALRAAIGRDFISVVAVPSQIAACLERQYGAGDAPAATWDAAVPEAPAASQVADVPEAGPGVPDVAEADAAALFAADPAGADADFGLVMAPPVSGDPLLAEAASALVPDLGTAGYLDDSDDVDDTLGLSLFGSAFVNAGSTDVDPLLEDPVLEDPVPPAAEPWAPGVAAPGGVADPAVGAVAPMPGEGGAGDVWQDLMALPVDGPIGAGAAAVEGPGTGGVQASADQVPSSVPEMPGAADQVGAAPDLAPELAPDLAPGIEPERVAELSPEPPPGIEPERAAELAELADPATVGTPVFDDVAGDFGAPAAAATGTGAVAAADDVAALTADLVDEAVASFEELHAEEQPDVEGSGYGPTAGFPALAKALVDGDRVDLEDMVSVLAEHAETGNTIARILTARRLVSEADLMWAMAQEMGLDFVDLDVVGVNYADARLLPESTCRHHNVLCIATDNGTPVVASSNPTDVFAVDDLRTIIGGSFVTVVATPGQIASYIGKAFSGGGDAADMAVEASRGFDGSVSSEQGIEDIQAATDDAPIVRYVNLLILQALNERASDIHVEPTAGELRIRYRIDGVLHDVSTAPRSIAAAVTTRLKVMADMNIAEHRVPQDGRISLSVGSKGVDLRMATLPTIHGEKVVMRVLDKSSVVLGFSDLGFDDDLLATYEGIYTKPYGTILVTGPTGSGKSTTLYTTLTALNSSTKNIITVEDPVELQIKGINQVQLNVKAGLTFAAALKSILRSDPDIVLVGEIRDRDTAVTAIEAALTGHLVLSTLHTNNAASTPMRLIEMGLEPFLVTSALSGILAQRLARRLCVHCKEAFQPSEADIMAAGWRVEEVERPDGIPKLYRAVGCSACSNTGYRGRKALAELMPMTEEIERMIIEGGSVDEIHRLAVSQGMVTLRESGLRKAVEGETTLEEVLRVVA